MRNLERDFHARFFVWDDVQHLEAGMKRLALLHNKRWDQKNSRHSFSTDRYISFHQAVAGAFASKGWLQLSCLELNGEIAGMYYDYCYNNKIYYYQGGFDPALQKYSPGLVLRAHIIQKAIADGLEEIDLLKGAYDYKYMWTNVSRSTVRLIIGKNSPAYKLLDFYIAKKPQLKSSLTKILPEKIVRAIKNAAI
jgi:CelD/BcsL family acetyltransferase involved in cellulose biosynthesis